MKNKVISIMNPKCAEELKLLGFDYIKQQIGKQTAYTFFETDELLHLLKSKFSQINIINGNKLMF